VNHPHSIPAFDRLRRIASGNGGQLLVLRAPPSPRPGSPWIPAGLHRTAATTLFEAALTLLTSPTYARTVAITGAGPHLPPLALGPSFRVGLTAGAWLAGSPESGARSPEPGTDAPADPDLLDLGSVRRDFGTRDTDRVLWTAQNMPWAERLSRMLAEVESRAGLEWQGTRHAPKGSAGGRTLVLIDETFLLPRADELAGAPPHQPFQASSLAARLADLSPRLGPVDVVVLSSADEAQLRERGLVAASLARPDAPEPARSAYPALGWPGMEVAALPALDPAQPHGPFYPGAPADRTLGQVLRTAVPRVSFGPLEELESMVGLLAVKEQVRGLVARLREDRERRARGLPPQDIRLHTVFYGNPGTGKTTVARLLARVFAESGLLSGGKFTEVTRADLVGQYVGETTQKTAKVCRDALGGVLFIDEAYALHRAGTVQDYGVEAIDQLVVWMSNHPRDLAVILAGYPREMRHFIAGANPGLVRRFDFHLTFEDYTSSELVDVVLAQARREHDEVDEAALPVVRERLERHRNDSARSGYAFGNAGDAIRLLQAARRARTARIAALASRSRDDLVRLTPADFARAELAFGPRDAGGTI
jgi:hypothetical protein